MRTRFTNESGASRYFGYLPPHGLTLAAHASIVIDGDLHSILAVKRGVERTVDNKALDHDLHTGKCTIAPVHDQSSSSSTTNG